MTDLQLSLIAAGGVFIVGVFSYNKWQEYKAKKSVERAFASEHDDVLMRSGEAPAYDGVDRSEPSFSLDDVPMVDGGSGAYATPEHGTPAVAPGITEEIGRAHV